MKTREKIVAKFGTPNKNDRDDRVRLHIAAITV
jgi:hypothetical protein